MLKKLLLILLPVIAFAAGAFGGLQLKPADEQQTDAISGGDHNSFAKHESDARVLENGSEDHGGGNHGDAGNHDMTPETFTFPSQFFVPLVRAGDSDGMMIMTIALQTTHDDIAELAKQEHRLRDILLRRLLIVANTGGFDGNFTTEGRLRAVREALLDAVNKEFGGRISRILIEDIARQQS